MPDLIRSGIIFLPSRQNQVMKKIALIFSAATIMTFAACGDNSSKDEGGSQVDEPVMNSGPNTEGERATDAVSDSAKAGSDSTVHRDGDAMSTPH
jgi:hypothetical protein